MRNLVVNGEATDSTATTLKELVDELLVAGEIVDGFAAAVNGGFVPKTFYADTILIDGDEIEILSPMQGG